jgi:hypothetical protein
MVTFNPRTGQLFDEDELLHNEEALIFLTYGFELMAGSERHFTLHSLRKMFEVYPALTQVNEWADEFVFQAGSIKPQLRLVDAQAPHQAEAGSKGVAYEFLDLRKDRVATRSELTRTFADPVEVNENEAPPGTVSINPTRGRVWKLEDTYIDKPSFEIQDYISLSGYSNGTIYGLGMERLPKLMHLPIRMANSTDVFIEVFANETRDQPDPIKEKRHVEDIGYPGLTLIDVIMAILESINLDDEDEYENERQYFEDSIEIVMDEIPAEWAKLFKQEFSEEIDAQREEELEAEFPDDPL